MECGAALVTGAADRIGRDITLRLARAGWDVAVHYNTSAEKAEKVAEQARSYGVKATALSADLLDPEHVERLVPNAVQALDQPLKLLINNASIFEYDTLSSATAESWDRHIGSNLRAPLFLSQSFAAQAPRASRDANGEPLAQAAIINLIDQRVLKPTPEFLTYSVAKHGLWALTRMTAQALAPDVRVNAIGPGPTVQGHRQSEAHFKAQRANAVLGRGASAKEISDAVEFILSAQGFTGQLLCVDGGQHLGWKTPDVLGPE